MFIFKHLIYEYKQLDELLLWLNPKGIREYRLKRELEKYHQNLVAGMKKRLTVIFSIN